MYALHSCSTNLCMSLSSSGLLQHAFGLEFLPCVKHMKMHTHTFLPLPSSTFGGNFKTIGMFQFRKDPKVSVSVKYPIWILLCFRFYLDLSLVVTSVFARKSPLVSICESVMWKSTINNHFKTCKSLYIYCYPLIITMLKKIAIIF